MVKSRTLRRTTTSARGPAYPRIFYSMVACMSYYTFMIGVFAYRDARDYRSALAEEKRLKWAETAEGRAQLADLARADERRREDDQLQQLALMESEAGREELAQQRRIKVADLRHQEMKLLYNLARSRTLMDDARRALLEVAQGEATERAAREAKEAAGKRDGGGPLGLSRAT